MLLSDVAMCNCITTINGLLAEQGFPHVTILRNLFGPAKAMIETYEEKKVRGKKAPIIQATFCPFCGEKYSEGTTAKAAG